MSASQLSVNGNEEIRVHWTVLQEPLNGVFSYSDESNGKITDLVYMPNPNFFGFDKVVLEASDNYSITTAEIQFHVLSVEDPLLFDEFPENLVEDENEKFDFFISYQDGDGLDSLNDFEITGLPLWLNLETVSYSSFSKTLRVYGEPTVEDIGTYNISASISEINGQEIKENFTVKVNFFNKPPIPVPASIKSSFVEDEYSVNSPKNGLTFFLLRMKKQVWSNSHG